MNPELQSRVDRLEDGRRLILQELGRMPPQARGWRSASNSWSPIQVVHHLALVEQSSLRLFTENRGRQVRARRFRDRLGSVAVGLVFRFGIRVRVPVEEVRPDPDVSLAEVEAAWAEHRDALLAHLRRIEPTRLKDPAFRHPVAGPMTYLEGVEFLVRHQEHHMRQLDRIRARPGFPWNA